MSGYKELEIYKEAFKLALEVHKASLLLPKFELYEQGSQIRRSSKRIKDTIAEGYGRRRYKAEFINYLTYAQGSCDETINHIETIKELYPEIPDFQDLDKKYRTLGRKINNYIQFVEKEWNK